ncbi:MAG: acyl-CoA carboxylase epsilon subunit [Polyangiaceae bacterium]
MRPTDEEAAAIVAVLEMCAPDSKAQPSSKWKAAFRDWGDPSTPRRWRSARDDDQKASRR